MTDQADILSKWLWHVGTILAKYQPGHLYTFWAMTILIFSPFYFFPNTLYMDARVAWSGCMANPTADLEYVQCSLIDAAVWWKMVWSSWMRIKLFNEHSTISHVKIAWDRILLEDVIEYFGFKKSAWGFFESVWKCF